MYDNFYRLRGNGFRLTPDHRLCFAHASYLAAFESIADARRQGEGFVVLTGAPGTGKTLLVAELFAQLQPTGIPIAKVSTTQVGALELLRLLAFAFDLGAEEASKAVLLERLENYFRKRHSQQESALLIIDEAQDLDTEALEELRLITNFTVGSEPLVQVLLVGEDRLWDKLLSRGLAQVHQRIIATCRLKPLTAAQTRQYLAHRLCSAGWDGDPQISGQAIARIHDYACGIPQKINSVMNRLLAHGADGKLHLLEAAHADEVLRQLSEDQLRPHSPLPDPLGLNTPSSTPPLRPLGALTVAAMKASGELPSTPFDTPTPPEAPQPPEGPGRRGDTVLTRMAMPRRLVGRITATAPWQKAEAWLRRTTQSLSNGAHKQAKPKQGKRRTPRRLPRRALPKSLLERCQAGLERVRPALRRSDRRWAATAMTGGALVALLLWARVEPAFGPERLAQVQIAGSSGIVAGTDNPTTPALPEKRGVDPLATANSPQGKGQSAVIEAAPTARSTVEGDAKREAEKLVEAANSTATAPPPAKSGPLAADGHRFAAPALARGQESAIPIQVQGRAFDPPATAPRLSHCDAALPATEIRSAKAAAKVTEGPHVDASAKLASDSNLSDAASNRLTGSGYLELFALSPSYADPVTGLDSSTGIKQSVAQGSADPSDPPAVSPSVVLGVEDANTPSLTGTLAKRGAQDVLEARPAQPTASTLTNLVGRAREKPLAGKAVPIAAGKCSEARSHEDTTTAQTTQRQTEATALLAAARRALSDYRLTLPPGDNAHLYLRAVLAQDPDNAAARTGLWRIVRNYAQLARRKMAADDLAGADRLVHRGLKVIPNDSVLLAVAEELADRRALAEIAHVDPGETTLTETVEVQESNEAGIWGHFTSWLRSEDPP